MSKKLAAGYFCLIFLVEMGFSTASQALAAIMSGYRQPHRTSAHFVWIRLLARPVTHLKVLDLYGIYYHAQK